MSDLTERRQGKADRAKEERNRLAQHSQRRSLSLQLQVLGFVGDHFCFDIPLKENSNETGVDRTEKKGWGGLLGKKKMMLM